MITVRYFAAAAEAAGCTTEQLTAGSAGELRAEMLALHPDLVRVLPRCSVLASGGGGGGCCG
jgi:molybdopterin converting factor small subunit